MFVAFRDEIAGFILAGGASSRMGRDKGLLEIGGEPLVLRTARVVTSLLGKVIVIGGSREYEGLGLITIPDEPLASVGSAQAPSRKHEGPLAGILTALHASSKRWNLILACDLPYMHKNWLRWLLARAPASNAQIVIPETENGLEPLAALYQQACAGEISAAVARGTRKITDALAKLEKEVLRPDDWAAEDPSGRVLMNMNTPGDHEQARRWWNLHVALR